MTATTVGADGSLATDVVGHTTRDGEDPVLRALSTELGLPLPTRTRFLQELASDIEMLAARLVAEGVAPAEARRRATDALVPDAETVRRLRGVHASGYRRVTLGLTPARLRRLERTALGLLWGTVVLFSALVLLDAGPEGRSSPFLWPVVCAGCAVVAAVFAKAFQLWIKRDHDDPAKGLGTLLGSSLAIAGLGTGGALVDTLTVASALEDAPHLAPTATLHWIAQDATLLAVSLTFALAGGLGWFVCSQWVAVVEDAHRRALALDPTLFTEERT